MVRILTEIMIVEIETFINIKITFKNFHPYAVHQKDDLFSTPGPIRFGGVTVFRIFTVAFDRLF